MDWSAFGNLLWHWAQGLVTFAIAAWALHAAWLPPLKDFIANRLDQRFKKQLQEADHAFQEKVRHVQSQIDRELDRARKLQDREFEALTEGWAIVHEAYWRARDATNRGYEIHDLTAMGEQQRTEFIDTLSFPNWQKKEIRDLQDVAEKQRAYLKAWRWSQYNECREWRRKLQMFADRKGIFVLPEIKQRFETLHDQIKDALLEFELRIRDLNAPMNAFNQFTQADRLRDQGKPIYDELEQLIRDRVWSPIKASP